MRVTRRFRTSRLFFPQPADFFVQLANFFLNLHQLANNGSQLFHRISMLMLTLLFPLFPFEFTFDLMSFPTEIVRDFLASGQLQMFSSFDKVPDLLVNLVLFPLTMFSVLAVSTVLTLFPMPPFLAGFTPFISAMLFAFAIFLAVFPHLLVVIAAKFLDAFTVFVVQSQQFFDDLTFNRATGAFRLGECPAAGQGQRGDCSQHQERAAHHFQSFREWIRLHSGSLIVTERL